MLDGVLKLCKGFLTSGGWRSASRMKAEGYMLSGIENQTLLMPCFFRRRRNETVGDAIAPPPNRQSASLQSSLCSGTASAALSRRRLSTGHDLPHDDGN